MTSFFAMNFPKNQFIEVSFGKGISDLNKAENRYGIANIYNTNLILFVLILKNNKTNGMDGCHSSKARSFRLYSF